jgi:hypothetical protein
MLAMFIMVILITPGALAVLPSVPPSDPSVGISEFHQVSMMQGDDPDTTEEEDRLRLTVVERTMWRIPHDSNEVYTYIPAEATNVLMDNVESFSHQGESFFIPGPFSFANNPGDQPEVGIASEGDYAGFQYWRFPIGADRDLIHPLDFNSTGDFDDADPGLTTMGDWDTSDDSLSISDNLTSSTYVSKRYTGGVGLVLVNMTIGGENEQNMTFEVSADNGATWKVAQNGSPVAFDDEGNEFRWRVTMTQDPSDNATPVLDYAYFDITFTPESTSIWIETSYVIDIPVGGFTFDMVFPFDGNSGLIFHANFDNDMSLDMTGTEVTEVVDGEYVGKTKYSHVAGGYSKQLLLEVKDLVIIDDDDSVDAWMLFAIIIILIFAAIAGLVLFGGRRKDTDVADGTSTPDEGDSGQQAGRSDAEDLEERRDQLVGQIKELDASLAEGLISKEDHKLRRAELKAEALSTMKRIQK